MDEATGDIRAVEFTSCREGDSPVVPALPEQITAEQEIGTVVGDGGHDTRRREDRDRRKRVVLEGRLPRRSARNEILRTTRRLGRTIRKRWSGYHVRSRIEARM